MVDLGWLAEVAKIGGGGAAGWIGRVFSERNKRHKVRVRLYREFVSNYLVIRAGLDNVTDGDPPMGGWRRGFLELSTNYYQHAYKDQDIYFDLPESASLNEVYKDFQKYNAERENRDHDMRSFLMDVDYYAWSIEGGFSYGTYDLRLAKKVLNKAQFAILYGRLRPPRQRLALFEKIRRLGRQGDS